MDQSKEIKNQVKLIRINATFPSQNDENFFLLDRPGVL